MRKILLYPTLISAILLGANSASAAEPVDVTPDGLNFESYEDGAAFKITASSAQGGWSNPAYTFRDTNPDAFTKDGQLTVLLARGGTLTQADVDSKYQQGIAVRDFGKAGKCLVITQLWSPGNNGIADGWAAADMRGIIPQYSFFLDPSKFTENTDKVHYVRVRLVYDALFRGCHYATESYAGSRELVRSIYATHDGNWVVPEKDHEVGADYAEDAKNFAKWAGETGKVEDIPANPEVYVPAEGEIDPWDASHAGHSNAGQTAPAYLMNSERFRVYEFDAPVSLPNTISVQFNTNSSLATYIIKEIKFTDLGTDEKAATLLGKRQLSWTYYNEFTSGIEDITVDEAAEGSDAPAVYYNLQGAQVKNPDNGIYIVRRGNKVTKEYIR